MELTGKYHSFCNMAGQNPNKMTDFMVICANTHAMPDSSPATMSVAFLHPFFDELSRRGTPQSQMAERLGLQDASLFDPQVVVSANSVYSFLRWMVDKTGDPLICAQVGQRMATGGWVPLAPLMNTSRSVADFLQKFSMMSSEQGRAATYKLEVEGAIALWRLVRANGASDDAAFADAVAAGFFVSLLKLAARQRWDPARIIAVLPEPKLVSHGLLPSTSVLSGRTGLILRFPSEYLGLEMPNVLPSTDMRDLSVISTRQITLTEQVSQFIEHRLWDPELGVDSIAKSVGLARWKLQSRLREDGTSVSRLHDDARRQRAIELVGKTPETVDVIARSLGYTNSSNFTRAFRGWTGKSPRDYRKTG